MKQTRREFIRNTALTSTAILMGLENTFGFNGGNKLKISGFTKELQSLDYYKTAAAVEKMGWDAIECPVRPGGHVLPERVEDDLPKMVEALTERNLTLDIMATNIHNPSEKFTERVLRAASKLGIKYYRLGWWNYDLDKPLQPQIDDIKAQLKDLAALNEDLGITGVYQNHSGGDSVGAPVWDIYELLKSVDSNYIGCHFDIGHATVEGGMAWRINYERIKKYIKAVIVKDFKWSYEEDQYGEPRWCPLGEGMIQPLFFNLLKNSSFNGPVTMHFEYHIPGDEGNRMQNMISAMTKDCDKLREWLK